MTEVVFFFFFYSLLVLDAKTLKCKSQEGAVDKVQGHPVDCQKLKCLLTELKEIAGKRREAA